MHKLTVLAFALLLIVTKVFGQSSKPVTINIKDARKSHEPTPEPSKHKHHDAIVYHTFYLVGSSCYKLVYYQKENGVLNFHAANYGSDDIMNMATYTWNKDTIAVCLYNTANKKEIKFKAFGNEKSSSIITDK